MPPMTATPVAIPQGKEHELEQEFELDIRVSSVSALPVLPATKAMGLLRLKMCRERRFLRQKQFPSDRGNAVLWRRLSHHL